MAAGGYFTVFLWGLLLLAAWAGWGSALLTALFRDRLEPVGWGLRAGLGMAVQIALGGVLALAHLANRTALILLVAAGLAWQAGRWARALRRAWPWHRAAGAALREGRFWILPAYLFPGLHYAASISWPSNFNACDDFLAYMVFPLRFLQTGTLIDPWNVRRLAAYGGHSLLQAFTQLAGREGNFHQLDIGLCALLLAGLITGFLRPRKPSEYTFAFVLVTAVMAVPTPRINMMAELSGAVLLLTLFRTLDLAGRLESPFRADLLTALAAAAACTIRGNFWPAALGALGFAAMGRAWGDPGAWPARLGRLLRPVALAVLFLAPWMLLSYASSGSLLYPLMRGTHQANYEIYSRGLGLAQVARWLVGYMTTLDLVPLLMLPVVFLVGRKDYRRAALPFAIAGLITCLATVGRLNFTLYRELYRYTFPMHMAVFLAAVLALARTEAGRIGRFLPWLFAVAMLVLNLENAVDLTAFQVRVIADHRPKVFRPEIRKNYQDLQARLAPGEPLLAIVDYPFLFDYRRNPIAPVDIVGACSPGAGFPYFQGPGAVADYLHAQGIHHLAAVGFDQSIGLYNRQVWIGHSHGDDQPVYTFESKYFFDFMDNIEALEKSGSVLYDRGGVRLVRF